MAWWQSFQTCKKFYELRDFTNTNRQNCPKCSFSQSMHRQTSVRKNRTVTFFIEYSRTKKSKFCCHPPFHPPIFCCHSLKLLSPTLPKLMNWILLSPPPLSSDPDTPKICNVHLWAPPPPPPVRWPTRVNTITMICCKQKRLNANKKDRMQTKRIWCNQKAKTCHDANKIDRMQTKR